MAQEKATIFTCDSFTVEESGNPHKPYFVVIPNASGVIALDEQGRILITREFRPKTQSYLWRVPAGRAEPGEDMLTCARRELREESGFDAKKLESFFGYEDASSWCRQRKEFFIAEGLFASPLDTGDEIIKPELHFMEPKQVLELLNAGEIIGEIALALYRFLHNRNLV